MARLNASVYVAVAKYYCYAMVNHLLVYFQILIAFPVQDIPLLADRA